MNEGSLISIVALIGWLVLAGSAMASFRLGWSRIAQLALMWLANLRWAVSCSSIFSIYRSHGDISYFT